MRFSLVLVAVIAPFGHCFLSGMATMTPRLQRYCVQSSSSDLSESNSTDSQNETNDLLERARKLRTEAGLLEEKLRETKPASSKQDDFRQTIPTKVTKLEDSVWKLSYRFSSQPKDDSNDEGIVVLPNYSGKLTVRLTPTGYCDIVVVPEEKGSSSTSSRTSPDARALIISKVWGWDVETSRQDNKQYLIFSMDVQFPESDPKRPNQVERCYLQARIDRGSDNSIVLQDGTVTVKKDVSEKTKGRWGLFQVAGILTEFRYVGDFIAKPA
eukprot:scaffold397_cov111-Cylindrotheca_fusiformis.AAC.4